MTRPTDPASERWHIAATLVDGCLSGHAEMSKIPPEELFPLLAQRFRDKLHPHVTSDALAYCLCRILTTEYA